MESLQPDDDYQLKAGTEKELARITADFRRLLIREAKRLGGNDFNPDDLETAYYRLGLPNRETEDAQTIITRTLKENRVNEWVAYGMALTLFLTGIVLLGAGVFGSQDTAYRITSIISGSIVELLLLLPFRFATNCRRHNIAIRMLGILIDRIDDPKKLAAVLKDTFLAVVTGKINVDSR
jgi:hypothetical protein